MAVQYSIQKMVSNGTLSTIALGIQYLQRNDIYIRIAGEETPQSGAPSGYTWSFINNTTLKILPVVPNGVEVVVYRRTDVDAMYNVYSQNAQFDEATIDENNQQLLYIAQEYLEQGIPGAGVDTLEFVRDDGTYTYYRIKRTDGSYSDEFAVPSAGSVTKILAREALRRSYAEAGYNLVDGSFEAGGTLVNANDVLLYEANGKAYSYIGTLPYTVAADTNPVGNADWTHQADSSLREELAGGAVGKGAYMIGTDHRGTLKEDLDSFDVRTSGQDLSTLLANSSDIYLDTVESGTPVSINYTAKIEGGAGGKITPVVKGVNGLIISSGGVDSRVKDVVIEGDGTVAASDTVATAGAVISADGVTMEGGVIKNLTMGCSVVKDVKGTKLIGNHYENMVAHTSLGVGGGGAGGYGVLTSGVDDLLILGQSSYGVNPNDRHAVYLSENASDLTQNKAVRIIGLRSDYSGAVNGGQNERTSPAIYGRGCLGIIIADTQITSSGSGIAFTDERQVFENISINNVQLENITASDSANYDSVGIRLQSYAGRSNVRGNINNVSIRMINLAGNTGARTYPIDVSGFRFLNISNIICASTGLTPAIRLTSCRDVNLSNIITLVNDGTSVDNAVPMIAFTGSCIGVSVSNINKGTGRRSYFSGLNNVTDLSVDFNRKANIYSVNGTITITDADTLISSAVVSNTNEITVTFNNHVTSRAVSTAEVRFTHIAAPHVTITNITGKVMKIQFFSPTGSAVALASATVGADITLHE